MAGRYGGRHTAVAFVFHQAQSAGFGHGEVNAGNAHVGITEFFPQLESGVRDQVFHVVGKVGAGFVVQQLGDLASVLVNCRHDDVRGCFFRQLHNVLAKVRLQRLDALFLKVMVQFHFLRDHGLAFDRRLGVPRHADIAHDTAGFITVGGPMHGNAVLGQLLFQLLQKIRQAGQGPHANVGTQVPKGFQVPTFKGGLALGHQTVHRLAKVLANLRVVDGRPGARVELFYIDVMGGMV